MSYITYGNPQKEYKRYSLEAEMIKDFEVTPLTEHVAWRGTLQLYKTKSGRFFIEHHSGLSGTDAIAVEITDYCKEPELLTLEEASRLHNALSY